MIKIADDAMTLRELAQDAGKNRDCCYAVLMVEGRGFYTPGQGYTNKAFAQFEHLRPGQRVAIYYQEMGATYFVAKLVREDECPEA